jgi:hypothetical protein
MRIDSTRFGSITIDGKIYPYDIYVLPSGEIIKRNKKNSPRIGGHRSLGVSEIEYLFSYAPDKLFIGKGQTGILPIESEAMKLLESSNITIIIDNTPDLIEKFNDELSRNSKLVALFHTTC